MDYTGYIRVKREAEKRQRLLNAQEHDAWRQSADRTLQDYIDRYGYGAGVTRWTVETDRTYGKE